MIGLLTSGMGHHNQPLSNKFSSLSLERRKKEKKRPFFQQVIKGEGGKIIKKISFKKNTLQESLPIFTSCMLE